VPRDAHSFRREYAEAEGYWQKQLEMYEGCYGKLKGKILCYYQLAVCLRRQERFGECVDVVSTQEVSSLAIKSGLSIPPLLSQPLRERNPQSPGQRSSPNTHKQIYVALLVPQRQTMADAHGSVISGVRNLRITS
jgi:hypothetical protein